MQVRSHRRGFSFIELLVVIAIIGILVALLLPAVQAAREAARRMQCSRNLAQLALAVNNYHNWHEFYPPGTIADQGPIQNVPQGYHHNWIVQILPYFEEKNAWSHVDQQVSVYHRNNAPVASLELALLQCPSDWSQVLQNSSYAGVHHDVEAPIDVDNNGVFFLNSRVQYDDVTDGASQTIFIGEKLLNNQGGLGWMSGTRATLRNAGWGINGAWLGGPGAPRAWGRGAPSEQDEIDFLADYLKTERKGKPVDPLLVVGGFGSQHPGGAQFAMGDGSAQFLAETMDPRVFGQLAHRADGKLLDHSW